MNQYAYAGNNPISARDPLGLCFVSRVGGTMAWPIGPPIGGLLWVDECSARNLADYQEGWNSMYGREDWQMPHHRQFGNPKLAARPRALSPQDAELVACLVNNWLSADAQELLRPVRFLTADLGLLINDPLAQAAAIYPNTLVFGGTGSRRDPLRAHGTLTLTQIIGHEVGHFAQYARMGIDDFTQLWNTPAGMAALQVDADEYAAQHVAARGPICK